MLSAFNLNAQLWLHFPVGSNNLNAVEIGDLDISGNQITIEALATKEYSTTPYYDIVTKHKSNLDCNYYFRTTEFAIRTTTGFVILLNPVQLCPDSSYHLAGTYDGDSIKYFVNGNQVASQHWTGTLFQNNFITSIGNISTASGYFEQFIGYLDEVRIWNVARTSLELSTNMYNLSNPTTQVGLKAYYKPGVNYLNLQGNPIWNGVLISNQTTQIVNPFFNTTIARHFCCSSFPTSTISVPSGTTKICPGDSVLLSGSGASNYLWSTGATTQSIYVKTASFITLTVTNSLGCDGVSLPKQITLSSPSAIITLTGDSVFCSGDSVKLSSNLGTSYLWSNGNNNQSFYVKSSGTFTVTVTNSDGCTAISQPINLYKGNPIANIILAGNDSILCNGDSVLLTANVGTQYLWSNGATSQSIYVNAAGNYTVDVTTSNICHSISLPQHISVLTPVAIIALLGDSLICSGDSVKFSTNLGSSYSWSNGNTSQQFYTNIAGVYNVTVVDINGCSAISNSIMIKLSSPISTISIINGDSILCFGDSVLLSANAGLNYSWSNGSTTQSIYINSAGIYQVVVTNSDNCKATSTKQNIIVSQPQANISAAGNGFICNNDTVTLTANSGGSYLWSNSSTSNSIKVFQPGIYSVTVTNVDLCKATDTITVFQSSVSVLLLTSDTTSFCEGDSCKLVATSSTNNFVWSNGAIDSILVAKKSGLFYVVATNSNGCSITSDSINVLVHPVPTINYLLDSIVDCDSYNITFKNNTISESNSTYNWDLGDGNFSNDFAPIHEYFAPNNFNIELTVTSPFGCISKKQSSFQTLRYVDPVALFTTIPLGSTYLDDRIVFTNLSTSATSYSWDFGDGTFSSERNPTHKYLASGTYHVSLIAFSSPSCRDTFELDYEVFLWTMPNVFTPNNDGLNDQFPGVEILGEMRDFEFEVYSRWGQRIFSSNNPSIGFKGKFENGKECPEGGYVYLISFESFTGFRFKKLGFFALIR